MGPGSTKNINSGATVGSPKRTRGNIFTDEKEPIPDQKDDEIMSKMFEMSHCDANSIIHPEKVISVAERSVLSQNFVNGTEESEESIIGV